MESTGHSRGSVVYFLRMPMQDIYISSCQSMDKANDAIERLRKKYDPVFIPKIATISSGYKSHNIYEMFSSSRIEDSNQFQPSPELIEFINIHHDPSPWFRSLASPDKFEMIRASRPGNILEVEISALDHNELIAEAHRQNVSPFEIVRELVHNYVLIRKAKRFDLSGWHSPEEQARRFAAYLVGKSTVAESMEKII